MAADRNTIVGWLADLSAAVVADEDDLADISNRLDVSAGLDPAGFAAEIMDLMRVIAESVGNPADFDRLAIPTPLLAGDTRDAMAVLLALGLAVAGCRVDWPSRPLARRARARITATGDDGLGVASTFGADGADLYVWLSGVVDMSVRLVSDLAANAVPIVRVETGISQPSTVLAYRLYGDANRASGLIDIADAMTPMVMPVGFDALAS